MTTLTNPSEASAFSNQVDALHELQNYNAVRLKFFKGTVPEHGLVLDEHGIPEIAHWNTKGDTPVKAIQEIDKFGWLVVYVDDQVIDLVKQYLEAK